MRFPNAATPCVAILVSLAAALAPVTAAAQVSLDALTIEDGLPQNSVTDIEQTRDGYLWLATFGGLVRFDGVRFTVFDRRTPGIESVRTRALHEDASGTLWAGTDDGMLIRFRHGGFTTFDAEDGLPPGVVQRIDSDANGAIWITWIDAVTRFADGQFVTYRPGDLPRDVRPRSKATHGSMVWWSVDADGVHCLVRGRVDLCVPARQLPLGRIVEVTSDRRGTVWVHTDAAAVVRAKDGDFRNYTPADGLPQRPMIGRFLEDRHGMLWFIEYAGGLYTFRDGRQIATTAETPLSIYQDAEGSIWVGTATRGLLRASDRPIEMRTVAQGLSSNNVYSVFRDRGGRTWAGTWGAGLTRFDGATVARFDTTQGLPSGHITAVFEDRAGRLLVGTPQGVAIVAGHRAIPYPDPREWLTIVWAIHQDDDGALWFGTNRGLVRQQGSEFTRYTRQDGLPDDTVVTLLGARGGGLWIGTARGVARLDGKTFRTYGASDGLTGNHVRALFEDERALWIGTYDGGLYRLAGGRLTRYTTADGLHDNGVFQILDDGHGHFWMGSNRGVSRVGRADLEAFAAGRLRTIRPVVFGVKDGLATAECNGGRQPSGMRMPDGTLWIPTQGGIAIVSPDRVRLNTHPPPVRIEDVSVAGSTVASFRDGLELPADHRSFQVQYTALSFVKPDLVRFRYKLVGLDTEWVEAGSRREAAYHRIPPGRYTFHVVAANSDGVWNDAGDHLAIVVVAPIWRRTWFVATAGAIAVAGLVAIERRRVVRLRREHARQQAYARGLIETQERERRRISHELHDSLGQTLFLIRQRARSAAEDAEADLDPTDVQPAFGDIARLAARGYDEMKEIAYDLRPFQLEKIGLTRTIEGMLGRVSRACGLPIRVDLDDIDDLFLDDTEISVYRIVQEGISNVVRHARATTASVTIRRHEGRAVVEIADDGVGFVVATRHAGGPAGNFGLTNLEERARALGGRMEVVSRPGHGTTLWIELNPETADVA